MRLYVCVRENMNNVLTYKVSFKPFRFRFEHYSCKGVVLTIALTEIEL